MSQARVGMFLQRIDGSWLTNPFWRNELLLASADQIAKLRKHAVQFIWIDTARGLDVEVVSPAAGAAAASPAPAPAAGGEAAAVPAADVQDPPQAPAQAGTPGLPDDPAAERDRVVHGFDPRAPREPADSQWGFDPRAPREPAKPGSGFDPRAPRTAAPGEAADAPAAASARREPLVTLAAEMQRAGAVARDVRKLVGGLYEQARLGHALDAERCLPLVDAVNESVIRNPDALITLTRLRKRDEYTYMHSVAVCALMVALGRSMGLDEDSCREAGLAGLLHDLGKAKVPQGILNKPGTLTREELSIIRTHPRRGYEMVAEARGATERVIDVTLHHHERTDGTGYPDQLSRAKISLFARMGAICDVYDAITSHRAYKSRWDPAESIDRMESWRGHFDEDILRAFVKTVGIFPVGAIVRLQSQRVAMVIEQNPRTFTKPVVQVFYSLKSKLPIPVQRVDLASPRCQDQIVSREPSESWASLDIDGLLKSGLSLTA